MSIVGYNWARKSGRIGLASSILTNFNRARNTFNRGSGIASRIRSRFRQKSSRSMTMSRRRKAVSSGQGVTDHFDARLIYRKKRMPRRQRRRWTGFVKKVKSAAERDLGTQTIVFNRLLSASNNVSGNHILTDFGLYGLASSQFEYNDLAAISTAFNNADNTTTKGLKVGPSAKLMFQSGVLDVTFRNSSTFFDGTTTRAASELKLEVDVYEMTCRMTSAETTGIIFPNLRGMFDQDSLQEDPIGGTGTEITRSARGVTPFDFPYALSRFGLKIWKKTKYQLSNGDTFTYQVRDPRRHVAEMDKLRNTDGFNMPGWTRIVVVIAKAAPGLTIGSAANTYTEKLDIGISRKYMCKVENYSENRSLYIS